MKRHRQSPTPGGSRVAEEAQNAAPWQPGPSPGGWVASQVVRVEGGTTREIWIRFDHFPTAAELPPGLWHRLARGEARAPLGPWRRPTMGQKKQLRRLTTAVAGGRQARRPGVAQVSRGIRTVTGREHP
jgi:hypothetical protein